MKKILIAIFILFALTLAVNNWQVLAGTAGVVGYRSSLNTGQGNPNVNNWRVSTGTPSWLNPNKYSYNYWQSTMGPKVPSGNNMPGGTTLGAGQNLNGMNAASSINFYHVSGDLNIGTDQTLAAGNTNDLIILVDRDLNINARIMRQDKGTFLGFIVGRNINVASNVTGDPGIDGFFLADGRFSVPKVSVGYDTQLLANGMFIAFSGFDLQRNLGNGLSLGNPVMPAEKFTFDPSLVINAPADFLKASYSWKEIVP